MSAAVWAICHLICYIDFFVSSNLHICAYAIYCIAFFQMFSFIVMSSAVGHIDIFNRCNGYQKQETCLAAWFLSMLFYVFIWRFTFWDNLQVFCLFVLPHVVWLLSLLKHETEWKISSVCRWACFSLTVSLVLFVSELIPVCRRAWFYNWNAVTNSHILSR